MPSWLGTRPHRHSQTCKPQKKIDIWLYVCVRVPSDSSTQTMLSMKRFMSETLLMMKPCMGFIHCSLPSPICSPRFPRFCTVCRQWQHSQWTRASPLFLPHLHFKLRIDCNTLPHLVVNYGSTAKVFRYLTMMYWAITFFHGTDGLADFWTDFWIPLIIRFGRQTISLEIDPYIRDRTTLRVRYPVRGEPVTLGAR